LTDLTSFQRLELILIPSTFLLSLVFIFLLGLNMIGSEVLSIIGIPVLLGLIIGSLFVLIIKTKYFIYDFLSLEKLFRLLVIIGGLILIPLILTQILGYISSNMIFSFLALIFSLIGTIMGITCLMLLYHNSFTHDLSG
jgi:hypothetical protein